MMAGAQGTLNRVIEKSYSTLKPHMGTATSLSAILGGPAAAQETVSFNGKTFVPTVTITDASGGSGGLMEITVTLDTLVFKTLKVDF